MSARVENLGDIGFVRETLSPEEELAYLESRQYICPCCDAEFTDRHVRMNRLTLLGYDSGLRPIYSPIDPVLYDVVICRYCGYGSLSKTFDNLSFKNAQIIVSSLPQKLKNVAYPLIYTEEVAIKRYRTALLNALLIREKSGVLAYIYMRLAWIYRLRGDSEIEKRMMLASHEGFLEATRKEAFPIIDLNESKTYYIMGDFLCRLSKEDAAKHYFSKALKADGINDDLEKRIYERPFMSGTR